MTFTTIEAVDAFRGVLTHEGGLRESVESLKSGYGKEEGLTEAAMLLMRAPSEIQEKAGPTKYPVIHLYCDRIESRPTEKLRRFSGKVRLVAEVRVSQDRLEGITESLLLYVDSVRDVVERNSGCMRDGLYLSSEYEVQIEPVRKGGLNFLQSAKVACVVIVNRT